MRFYKDPNSAAWQAIPDGADSKYIRPGYVEITQAEADALRAPTAEEAAAQATAEAEATQLAADRLAAKQYAKLVALANMTPAQIQAWIDANVTNLSQAQDAIKTLAIGLSILVRRELR